MEEIVFTLSSESSWIDESYYPVPASKEVPEWYKSMEASKGSSKENPLLVYDSQTIKRCMPVFDAITTGYILKTFTDIYVNPSKDGAGTEVRWAYDTQDTISFHGSWQLQNYKNMKIDKDVPKFRSPWFIKTPPGYSCLFISPLHRPPVGFKIMEGIVDTDQYKTAVQLPFLLEDGFEGLIPAGTPIVQVIPFKRTDFKMRIGGEKELAESLKDFHTLKATFINGYRNKFRVKKNYL